MSIEEFKRRLATQPKGKVDKRQRQGIARATLQKYVQIVELSRSNINPGSLVDEKEEIGPLLFKPCMKLGKGSFGEVYLV